MWETLHKKVKFPTFNIGIISGTVKSFTIYIYFPGFLIVAKHFSMITEDDDEDGERIAAIFERLVALFPMEHLMLQRRQFIAY